MKAQLRKFICLAGMVFALSAGAADEADVAGDPVQAVWQAHQVSFRYFGFTSYYSCDGLRGKLRKLLRAIGARDDVKTTGACSDRLHRVTPIHRVILAFSLPVPATEGAAPGETFPAEWRKVDLSKKHPTRMDWGDCELVEQFRDQIIIPLLNPQDMKDSTRCTPQQMNIGSPHLEMTALVPLPPPPAPVAGAEAAGDTPKSE